MTVAELIEELRKHPGHHTVMLETYDTDLESGSQAEVWSFIGEIAGQSGIDAIGPVVRIVAESITQ